MESLTDKKIQMIIEALNVSLQLFRNAQNSLLFAPMIKLYENDFKELKAELETILKEREQMVVTDEEIEDFKKMLGI